MTAVIETDDFKKRLGKLPKNVVHLYQKQKGIFKIHWRDSRLHTKKLVDLGYSFRVTRSYRVLFYFYTDTTAVFVDIGDRKNIYG